MTVDCTDDPNTSFTLYDTTGDGNADLASWDVPEGTTDFYLEAEITVLNITSNPIVGENWEVNFDTISFADLTIYPVNGTIWTNDEGSAKKKTDLVFLELRCGDVVVQHQWIDDAVFVENYSCNETTTETSKVLTAGHHYLEFKFGDDIANAQNLAFVEATLIIEKITQVAAGTFFYAVTGKTPSTPSILTTPTTGSVMLTSLVKASSPFSIYSVSEDIDSTPFFNLKTDPSCVNQIGSPRGSLNSEENGITGIVILGGETITCTFENEKDGLLDMVKTTIGGDDTFFYVISGPQISAHTF